MGAPAPTALGGPQPVDLSALHALRGGGPSGPNTLFPPNPAAGGGGMVMTPGGGGTGAPLQGPSNFEGQFPSAPGVMGAGGNLGGMMPRGPDGRDYRHDARDAFHQSMLSWLQQRPTMGAGGPEQFRTDIMTWIGQRPDHRGFFADYMQQHPYGATASAPAVPVAPQQGLPTPLPPVPAPPAPTPAPNPGGVGTSLGVIGATPAQNPYGLPTY